MSLLSRLAFQWRKFFAVLAFNARQRRRERRLYPTKWLSHFQLVHSDVALAHEADPALVDEHLLERLIKGRDDAQKALKAQAAISTGITAFLLLTIFKVDLPLTVGGIQLKAAPGVIEILMVLNSAWWCAGVARLINAQTMTTAIKAALLRLYPPETTYLHHAALHGNEPPSLFPHPMSPHLTWKRPTYLAALATLLMLLGLLFSLLAIAVATRVVFYHYAWTNPSVEQWLAYSAVGFSVALDALALCYLLVFLLPLPYRDNSHLTALEIAEQTNPLTLRKLREDAYGDAVKDRLEMERKGYLKQP